MKGCQTLPSSESLFSVKADEAEGGEGLLTLVLGVGIELARDGAADGAGEVLGIDSSFGVGGAELGFGAARHGVATDRTLSDSGSAFTSVDLQGF